MDNTWIKENREALGLSQRKLAAALDIGSNTLANWEGGVNPPSVQLWPRLAAFFQSHGLAVPEMPTDLPKAKHTQSKTMKGTDPAKLKERRLAAGMTIKRVAEAVGLSRGTIGRYERGVAMPSKRTITALCELFQCTPEELGYPRIKNGMTTEERNALSLEFLHGIEKALSFHGWKLYAARAEREDVRQDAILAVLEAIGRAEDPDDPEKLRHYVFAIAKGAILNSIRRASAQGFTGVPYGTSVRVMSLDHLLEEGLDHLLEENEKL